jgi:hypothetical protein
MSEFDYDDEEEDLTRKLLATADGMATLSPEERQVIEAARIYKEQRLIFMGATELELTIEEMVTLEQDVREHVPGHASLKLELLTQIQKAFDPGSIDIIYYDVDPIWQGAIGNAFEHETDVSQPRDPPDYELI